MEFGIALPTSGALASPANIAQVAREAERMGYSALWTYERLLRPLGEVTMRTGKRQIMPETNRVCYEPLETLSYVCGMTSKIKLGTSIINALFHPPVVLARRFATLDQLSSGRVVAGLGQGWLAEEFQTVGVPMSRRGEGMDEVIAAMRACWGSDPVTFKGKFYEIPTSEVNPKPVQTHVPVLLGAMTERGVARAARIADGIIVIANSKEIVRNLIATFIEAADRERRDPDQLQIVIRSNGPLTRDPLSAERSFLTGSPEQIASDVAELKSQNVDHVMFDNEGATSDVEEELTLMRDLKASLDAAI
jgi:probable F420-dependent oxidoreductase